MAKWFKISFALLFVPFLLFSQNHNMEFEHLTVEDGLAGNRVQCILQDSRGYMWFGTENGLNKYDGYKFTTYSPDPDNPNSISHSFIYSILEDYNGDIWIGTYGGGLHKFDREEEIFINYEREPDDPFSLSNNYVTAICQSPIDGGKTLWVGTRWGGLNKLIIESERFDHYQNYTQNFSKINITEIFNLYYEDDSTLWIGTNEQGLIHFNPGIEKFNRYNDLDDDDITTIYQDHAGVLWIGTHHRGLIKFNRKKQKFTRYLCDLDNQNSISDDHVLSICEDKLGRLWIGTSFGLNIFDAKTEKFSRIQSDENSSNSISNDYITSIFQDRSGIFWIGTLGGGINKYNPDTKNFKHVRVTLYNSSKASANSVRSIQEDITNNKVLWLGTSGAGLIKYDITANKYLNYYGPTIPLFVRSIYQNPQTPDAIWIATWGHGLIKLNKKSKQISEPTFSSQTPNHINTICEIRNGLILLGTTMGLYEFDCSTENIRYIHDPDKPNSLIYVTSICRDHNREYWVGTQAEGLKKFRLNSDSSETNLNNLEGQFIHFTNNPEDPGSISSNSITFVYEDKNNIIWVGTHGGGLNKLANNNTNDIDQSTEEFMHYRERDGSPSDIMFGILEDDSGNLWLSTNKGISKFNTKDESFRNYDIRDGLQSNEFNLRAYFESKNGKMYFGGINGFNSFYSDSIKNNPKIPLVVITDFQIFNKSIKPGRDSQLIKSISETKEIILSHDQTVFSFEFAALDYTSPGQNKYAYKMEGIDPDWVFTDASRRYVTYTHLSPREYVFRVKGSNNDGVWNEEGASLKIIILPPWWRTNWAYSLFLLFVSSLVYGFWRFKTNRLKVRQQMEMEHFEAEKLREVDHLKSRFFANISHEFRTPLTLIQGPVKQMLFGDFKGNVKEQYRMILRYSNRLLNLINQILDLSKLESGQMNLKVSRTDIMNFLKGIVQSFASLAERKKITLKFKVDPELIMGYVDRDKLEKVVTNLLSNAFKFTSEGGSVEVNLSLRGDMAQARSTTYGLVEKQSPSSDRDEIATSASRRTRDDNNGIVGVQIKIFNSGTGIASDQLGKIFDRFYQANESYIKDSEGTGIGLALTKEQVEAHHGEIHVENELDKGTTFTVRLPIEKECFKPEEIIEDDVDVGGEQRSPVPIVGGMEDKEVEIITPVATKRPSGISKSAPLLLIVEDNPDVTTYISSFLEKDYRIITAENGQVGLHKALKKIPDLIISDIMMPIMDGFELCHKLKTDQRTSHIPVILLTARAAMEDRIEGFETGADAYIPKPFDAKELQVRVKNLVEQRQKLRERFQQEFILRGRAPEVTSVDERFLNRAIEIVEEHLSDADFTVERFTRQIGMSAMQLHRKLKALTAQSANQFIRTVRLKRAAFLIQNGSGNISEVAYEVGFNNPAYFAERFRKLYGESPSRFSARQRPAVEQKHADDSSHENA